MFPSFPLTDMQKAKKNFLRGAGNSKKCVCLSVCASPQQSQITLDVWVEWQTIFQGLLNSLQVIFGRVTPGPSGSGPDPKKAGFCKIYLLWGQPRCNGVMDSTVACCTGGPGSIPAVCISKSQYSVDFLA